MVPVRIAWPELGYSKIFMFPSNLSYAYAVPLSRYRSWQQECAMHTSIEKELFVKKGIFLHYTAALSQ